MSTDSSEMARQFVQHRDVLYGYIFALTRNHDAAEDVLQDVGVSILTEATRGTRPENFLSWARGLARHRVADYYRRQSRRNHEAPLEDFADAVDLAFTEHAPAPEDYRQQLTLLRVCMENLTERVRTMIGLRYEGKQSLEQIAAAMSWTPGAIKVALCRARRVLGECVARKLGPQEEGRR